MHHCFLSSNSEQPFSIGRVKFSITAYPNPWNFQSQNWQMITSPIPLNVRNLVKFCDRQWDWHVIISPHHSVQTRKPAARKAQSTHHIYTVYHSTAQRNVRWLTDGQLLVYGRLHSRLVCTVSVCEEQSRQIKQHRQTDRQTERERVVTVSYWWVKLLSDRSTQWSRLTSVTDNNVTRPRSASCVVRDVTWLTSLDNFWTMSVRNNNNNNNREYF